MVLAHNTFSINVSNCVQVYPFNAGLSKPIAFPFPFLILHFADVEAHSYGWWKHANGRMQINANTLSSMAGSMLDVIYRMVRLFLFCFV